MPPIRMKGDGRKAKNPKKTLARLLSYLKPYRVNMTLVVVCILFASLATALSSYSLEPLINDYIKPLTGQVYIRNIMRTLSAVSGSIRYVRSGFKVKP